jgi:hypothetical protein
MAYSSSGNQDFGVTFYIRLWKLMLFSRLPIQAMMHAGFGFALVVSCTNIADLDAPF